VFDGKSRRPILDLIGGEIERTTRCHAEKWAQSSWTASYTVGRVGRPDVLRAGRQSLAKYADQFYAGAGRRHPVPPRHGGAVTYCGVHGEQSFTKR
jgi:hypothetical protein